MTLGLTSPTKSSYNSTLQAFSALESVDMSPLGLTAETGLNTVPTQHFVFALSCLAPAGGHTQDAFVSVGCLNWKKKMVKRNCGFHKHKSSKEFLFCCAVCKEQEEVCQHWKGDFSSCLF